MTNDEVVTKVRSDINDDGTEEVFGDSFIKNKLNQGMAYLRRHYPDTCSSWVFSGGNLSPTIDESNVILKENYLETFSLVTQLMMMDSTRWEDVMYRTMYYSDVSGAVDTRRVPEEKEKIISDIEGRIADQMAAIFGDFTSPVRGQSGLDAAWGE